MGWIEMITLFTFLGIYTGFLFRCFVWAMKSVTDPIIDTLGKRMDTLDNRIDTLSTSIDNKLDKIYDILLKQSKKQ